MSRIGLSSPCQRHSSFISGVRCAIGANVKPVLVAKAEAAAAASLQRSKDQVRQGRDILGKKEAERLRKDEAIKQRRDNLALPTDQAETAALVIQDVFRKKHPPDAPAKRLGEQPEATSGKGIAQKLREQPGDEAVAARHIQRPFRQKAPRIKSHRGNACGEVSHTKARVIVHRISTEDDAARIIQQCFRKKKTLTFDRHAEVDQAAAAAKRTQNMFREQRQEFATAMGMKSSSGELQGETSKAAVVIQKRFRGNRVRRLQSVVNPGVKPGRSRVAEQFNKQHFDAARSIQRMFRDRRNQKEKERQIAAKRIQRNFRSKKEPMRQAHPGSAQATVHGDFHPGLQSSGTTRAESRQPEKFMSEDEQPSPRVFEKHSRSAQGYVSAARSLLQQHSKSARRQKLAARAAERAALRDVHASRIEKKAQMTYTPVYSAEIVKHQQADEGPPDLLKLSSLQPCLRKVLLKRILPPVQRANTGKRRPTPSGVLPLAARSLPGPAEGMLRRLADTYHELKSVPVDPLSPRSPMLRLEESRPSPRTSSIGAKALASPTEASIASLTGRHLILGGSCGGPHVGITSFRPCWMTQQHRY